MSGLAFNSNNSGTATVTIQTPAVNTPVTHELPKHSGKVAAFGAPAAKAATGTSVDFINGVGDDVIPDDARRITVVPSGASTNGTSPPLLQLGDSSGFKTSGYASTAASVSASSTAATASTAGFILSDTSSAATHVYNGAVVLVRTAGNLWVSSHSIGISGSAQAECSFGGGAVTLSGSLDRIRITTVNGTDQYDGGTFSILVE